MTYLRALWITLVLLSIGGLIMWYLQRELGVSLGKSDNLTCYQCTKQVNEECSQADLKQCSPEKDRCVTHITKDEKNGFSIKRECGLGPCGFDDDMMNRGLGLDGCDRSKHEYFCLFCCRTNGCNKSSATLPSPSFITSFISLTSILVIYFSCGLRLV